MKIVRHSVIPVVPPPPTFDIVGLTGEDMEILMALVGVLRPPRGNKSIRNLYSEISIALNKGFTGESKYRVTNGEKHILGVDLVER